MGKEGFVGTELYGQTLGIIGLGRIGSIVADRTLCMKMEVLCFDPYVLPEAAAIQGVELVSLDELLARSDFITLHTPMTVETRQIINRTNLAKMKPGVRLINCARGGLVDEEALHEALVEGRVAGAALDVFNQEPPPAILCWHCPTSFVRPIWGVECSGPGERRARHCLAGPGLPADGRHPQRRELSVHASQGLRKDSTLSDAGRTAGGPPGTALHPHPASGDRLPGSDLQDVNLQPLTYTVIKGLLDPILEEKVNLVNAPLLLKERQIELITSSLPETKGYTGLITVRVKGKACESSAAGTVLPGEEVRLIRLNDYPWNPNWKGPICSFTTSISRGPSVSSARPSAPFRSISPTCTSPAPPRATARSPLCGSTAKPPGSPHRPPNHPNIVSVQQVRL